MVGVQIKLSESNPASHGISVPFNKLLSWILIHLPDGLFFFLQVWRMLERANKKFLCSSPGDYFFVMNPLHLIRDKTPLFPENWLHTICEVSFRPCNPKWLWHEHSWIQVTTGMSRHSEINGSRSTVKEAWPELKRHLNTTWKRVWLLVWQKEYNQWSTAKLYLGRR